MRASALADVQAVPMLGLRIAVSEAALDRRQGLADQAARRLSAALARLPAEAANDASADMRESLDLAKSLGI